MRLENVFTSSVIVGIWLQSLTSCIYSGNKLTGDRLNLQIFQIIKNQRLI